MNTSEFSLIKKCSQFYVRTKYFFQDELLMCCTNVSSYCRCDLYSQTLKLSDPFSRHSNRVSELQTFISGGSPILG